MRLRGTIRIRNDEMVSAREHFGLSQSALAKLAGTTTAPVMQLEALRYKSRSRTHKTMRLKAENIAAVLDLPVASVLPLELIGHSFATTRIELLEVPVADLRQIAETEGARLLGHAKNEIGAELVEVHDELEALKRVAGLTCRERRVLEERYPASGAPLTLKKVAINMGIKPSRVHQIEQQAIQKLKQSAGGKERSSP